VTWGKAGPRGATGDRGKVGGSGARGPAGPAEVKIIYSAPSTLFGDPALAASFGDWTMSVACWNDDEEAQTQLTVSIAQASGVTGTGSYASSYIRNVGDQPSTADNTSGTLGAGDVSFDIGGEGLDGHLVGTVVLTTASDATIGQLTYSAQVSPQASSACSVVGLATMSGG
jgi:hypothetical protein